MSTHVDIAHREDPYLRISLCASGAVAEHLEIVMDGRSVDVFAEDVPLVRSALDELERFVASRGGGKK